MPPTTPSSPAGPPRWVWLVYLALFGASVPWYLPDGPIRLWFGLPYWVVLSLCAIAGVAGFTQFVLHRYWPDDEHDAPQPLTTKDPAS